MSGVRRKIKRIAFLQEYRNRPDTLKELLPEVADKGYHAVAFAARPGQETFIAELSREAGRRDLEVMTFTGFMKYEEAWLNEHPEQRMVLCSENGTLDQDKVRVNWGCPFNPEFRKRYFTFLEFLGKIPEITEVWINDEAFMGFDEESFGCYCQTCRKDWESVFGGEIPRPPFKDNRKKAEFINWRFNRWNDTHRKMKEILNRDHRVRAVYLSSPVCCIGLNSWVSAVDIGGMLEHIDGVMTDPYYTFHNVAEFTASMPHETYLSEYCRYLNGMAGDQKLSEICVQGFSHSTFTRPLDERDGWWSSIVPLALGIDNVTAYTYLLQKMSPVQKPFEIAFKLDEYFSRTRPLDFAAIVDSIETRSFHLDAARGPDSWQLSRMIPLADVMRRNALPYTYIPSRRLVEQGLSRWPVIILPGVSCVSAEARETLRAYVAGGGILLACGETAVRDGNGIPGEDPFMAEVFGIRRQSACNGAYQFAGKSGHPAFAGIPWPDEVTAEYMGGSCMPVLALEHVVAAETGGGVEVLAHFEPGSGEASGHPALTVNSFGRGMAVYAAGIPGRVFVRPEFRLNVQNHAGRVIARVVAGLASASLSLRVKDFPPRVPMDDIRPLDQRLMPTAEFMPGVGDDLYLATIASYFREPMNFVIEAVVPDGKNCREVTELVSGRTCAMRKVGNRVETDVEIGFDDCIKVFAFIWE